MDYNLAKQLKDAGFPQDVGDRKMRLRTDEVVIPTLEELVDACGDRFALHKNEANWCAWIINSTPSSTTPYNRAFDLKQYGSTPTEAVAKLWLALNQKEV